MENNQNEFKVSAYGITEPPKVIQKSITPNLEPNESQPSWAVVSHQDTQIIEKTQQHLKASSPSLTPPKLALLSIPPPPKIETYQFSEARKPQRRELPSWLSVPILTSLPFLIGGLLYAFIIHPMTILALTPIAIVGSLLWWMGRIKPNNWPYWVQAFLWGAGISVIVSYFVQQGVEQVWLLFSDSSSLTSTSYISMAAVVIAPLIEEITKGAVVLWIITRYKKIDGIFDAVLVACWAALGFTVSEDVLYIFRASQDSLDSGFYIFIARCLFTPFTHTIFTFWIGLSIGRAIQKNQPLISSWWGWAIAIGAHALWNAVPIYLWASSPGDFGLTSPNPDFVPTPIQSAVILMWGTGFVALFITMFVFSIQLRSKKKDQLNQLLPWLTKNNNFSPYEEAVFWSLDNVKLQKSTSDSAAKKRINDTVSSLARLAELITDVKSGNSIHEYRQNKDEIIIELNEARNIAPPSQSNLQPVAKQPPPTQNFNYISPNM